MDGYLTIDSIIENVFRNIFLLAVANRLDLASIVAFVDKQMQQFKEPDKTSNTNYSGLVFVNILAEEMDIPISDLLNFDYEYQLELLKNIISSLSMDGIVLDIDETKEEAYVTYLLSNTNVYEKTAEFVYTGDCLDQSDETIEKNNYIIELVRENDAYSMSILTNNLPENLFLKGQIEVWKEKEGLLADYIEESFEENITLAFREGTTQEELVACVFNDTRTISLLDKYEGFGDKYNKSYHHLVIKNGMRYCSYNDPYIHLVIERRTTDSITGDITFTEFKQESTDDLRQHIINELDQNIIDNYRNKDQYYRFKTGYRLRAQNSKNRSGYGWYWDWRNGVGTYVKGTEYGETTEYVFAGGYISDDFLFDANNRDPMVNFLPEEKNVCESMIQNNETYKNIESPVQEEVIISEPEKEELREISSESNGQEKKCKETPIFDISSLRAAKEKPIIGIGSRVVYKKLHLDEIIEEVIGDKKLIHKKLLGKTQGDIILDGSKRFLVVEVCPGEND